MQTDDQEDDLNRERNVPDASDSDSDKAAEATSGFDRQGDDHESELPKKKPGWFDPTLTPEQKLILAEQGREAFGKELDVTDFLDVRLQLANGHDVRVALRIYEKYYDYGVTRVQSYSISVFSWQDSESSHMVEHHLFHIHREESLTVIPALWKWLIDLRDDPRRFAEYDAVDEFIEDMADQIDVSSVGEDACDYIKHNTEIPSPEPAYETTDLDIIDPNAKIPGRGGYPHI